MVTKHRNEYQHPLVIANFIQATSLFFGRTTSGDGDWRGVDLVADEPTQCQTFGCFLVKQHRFFGGSTAGGEGLYDDGDGPLVFLYLQGIARFDGFAGFDPCPIDMHQPPSDRFGSQAPCFIKPGGPKPFIDANDLFHGHYVEWVGVFMVSSRA